MCAMCAVAVCLLGAGKQFKLNDAEVLFRDAQAHLAKEQTPEAFAYHYGKIHAKDPERAKHLAALYFWLIEDDAVRENLFSATSRTRQGGIIPMRVAAPITGLTVTSFTIGTTSFIFRVDWPVGMELPQEKLEFMGKLDLSDEDWAYLDDVPINSAQGYKEFEILFDELPSLYMEEMDFAQKAFFKFQPSEPEEEWTGGFGDKDSDDFEDPDIPPPSDWKYWEMYSSITLADFIQSFSTQSIPVRPGRFYLVTLSCRDFAAEGNEDLTDQSSVYTWDISLPDGQRMSGSTDTPTLRASIPPENDPLHPSILQDFRIFYVPDFEPPAAGPQFVSAPSDRTIEAFASIERVAPNTSFRGGVFFTYRVLNIVQKSLSMSVAGENPGSTDLGGGLVNQVIHSNGVAFISGYPVAPNLEVTLSSLAPRLRFECRLEIESERADKRKTRDDRKYPANGSWHEHLGGDNLDITATLMNREIVGGKCKFHYKITDKRDGRVIEDFFPFYIRGLNPPDAVVQDYITDTVDDAFKGYAWAIYKHETRDGAFVYNQFNVKGKDYKHRPCWGYPDGWGIAQIDRSGDDPPSTATTEEVYNWRTNVLSGSQTLKNKKAIYESHTNYFRMTEPVKFFPPGTHTFNGVIWPAEQYAVTVFFNGADTNTIPKSLVWKGNRNKKGEKLFETIYSPVKFRPGTRTWTFHDNKNRYAYQVSKEFNPQAAGLPPTQEQ